MNGKTPLQAIRAKCLDCSGGSTKEVSLCNIIDCSLHPYRFGTNPNRRGVGKIKNIGRIPMEDNQPIRLIKKTPTEGRIISKESILEGDSE